MKKVLIIAVLFFFTVNTAFAQKSLNEVVFQKIDTAKKDTGKTWFARNQKILSMAFYPAPDSVIITGKKATMFFINENLKTTVTTQFCEKYLNLSANEILVKVRLSMLLYKIHQKETQLLRSHNGPGSGPTGLSSDIQTPSGVY